MLAKTSSGARARHAHAHRPTYARAPSGEPLIGRHRVLRKTAFLLRRLRCNVLSKLFDGTLGSSTTAQLDNHGQNPSAARVPDAAKLWGSRAFGGGAVAPSFPGSLLPPPPYPGAEEAAARLSGGRWSGRGGSVTDSDCEDVFSEESSSKDSRCLITNCFSRCSSPSENADSCHMMSRKRRRGIIEKRRRDRINCSLSELRRLVPTAFEKQGSAKLEKAEILQLTVDHLKTLHAKGTDAFNRDPHKFAMDYHGLGFRECAAEVARYLVTVEGLDVQDPLRLRLMSHLQCFAAQRELSSSSSPTTPSYPTATPPSWGFTTPHNMYQSPPGPPPPPPPPAPPSSTSSSLNTPSAMAPLIDAFGVLDPLSIPVTTTSAISTGSGSRYPTNAGHPSAFMPSQHQYGGHQEVPATSAPPTSSHQVQSIASPSIAPNISYHHLTSAQPSYHHQHHMPPSVPTVSSAQSFPSPGGQMKPYRPWGAEVAY
ncbi:hypothetical protein J437_LFUL008786 [Ladona fulva]|uniref:Hairy/enhancer-of-split related with YRPW motif protein n=1 Tax=Ladona fulva TaxID=123851 RepID=A0A8K0JZ79_LADFU|nr:hypothetical protein J437_LFUL008786 [Ladona fulva]